MEGDLAAVSRKQLGICWKYKKKTDCFLGLGCALLMCSAGQEIVALKLFWLLRRTLLFPMHEQPSAGVAWAPFEG